jgi:hypothetical protein
MHIKQMVNCRLFWTIQYIILIRVPWITNFKKNSVHILWRRRREILDFCSIVVEVSSYGMWFSITVYFVPKFLRQLNGLKTLDTKCPVMQHHVSEERRPVKVMFVGTVKLLTVNGGVSPHIRDLGGRWRWVVSFTPWPLYLWIKSLFRTVCEGCAELAFLDALGNVQVNCPYTHPEGKWRGCRYSCCHS